MYELPLFPLNTVLFPGMPLPLQIFEERYKEMIALCLREHRPFGVVKIQEGVAEGGPVARPHLVGCTAEIAQVEELDDGRMLIMTIGRERFRIVQLQHDNTYLVGSVEPAPLIEDDCARTQAGADALYNLVKQYLEILGRTGSVEFDAAQIPEDVVPLIYLAATIIQLPAEEKQELLAIDRASLLLQSMLSTFRREVTLMRTMPSSDQGIFSQN